MTASTNLYSPGVTARTNGVAPNAFLREVTKRLLAIGTFENFETRLPFIFARGVPVVESQEHES